MTGMDWPAYAKMREEYAASLRRKADLLNTEAAAIEHEMDLLDAALEKAAARPGGPTQVTVPGCGGGSFDVVT